MQCPGVAAPALLSKPGLHAPDVTVYPGGRQTGLSNRPISTGSY
jgi:hypothetical protein